VSFKLKISISVLEYGYYYCYNSDLIFKMRKLNYIAYFIVSKAWLCGLSLARIVGSIPAGSWMFVFCERCVLSGRGLALS